MTLKHTVTVWWIPQVPMKAFEVEVPDLDTAVLVCNVLADYDIFQYENKVKPDYCNVGGIRIWHELMQPGDTGEIFTYDDEGDLECARDLLASCTQA